MKIIIKLVYSDFNVIYIMLCVSIQILGMGKNFHLLLEIENSGYLLCILINCAILVVYDFRFYSSLHVTDLSRIYLFDCLKDQQESCSLHWIARNTKKFLCKVYRGGSWCLQCNLCLILPWANLFNFDVKLSNCTNTWPEWLFRDIFQHYLFIVWRLMSSKFY